MGNRYLLQRLIEWLNKLSDSELEELSRLFSEPQVRTKLFAIIDNALALRHIEGKPKLQPVASARDWPSRMPKREVGRDREVMQRRQLTTPRKLSTYFSKCSRIPVSSLQGKICLMR